MNFKSTVMILVHDNVHSVGLRRTMCLKKNGVHLVLCSLSITVKCSTSENLNAFKAEGT